MMFDVVMMFDTEVVLVISLNVSVGVCVAKG